MDYSLLLYKRISLQVEPGGVTVLCAMYVPLFPALREYSHSWQTCINNPRGAYCSVTLTVMPQSPWLRDASLWYVEVAVNKICTALSLKTTFIYLPGVEREADISGFSELTCWLLFQWSLKSLPQNLLPHLFPTMGSDALSEWLYRRTDPFFFFTAFQNLFHQPFPLDYIPSTKRQHNIHLQK